jgi:hypothetical protein
MLDQIVYRGCCALLVPVALWVDALIDQLFEPRRFAARLTGFPRVAKRPDRVAALDAGEAVIENEALGVGPGDPQTEALNLAIVVNDVGAFAAGGWARRSVAKRVRNNSVACAVMSACPQGGPHRGPRGVRNLVCCPCRYVRRHVRVRTVSAEQMSDDGVTVSIPCLMNVV